VSSELTTAREWLLHPLISIRATITDNDDTPATGRALYILRQNCITMTSVRLQFSEFVPNSDLNLIHIYAWFNSWKNWFGGGVSRIYWKVLNLISTRFKYSTKWHDTWIPLKISLKKMLSYGKSCSHSSVHWIFHASFIFQNPSIQPSSGGGRRLGGISSLPFQLSEISNKMLKIITEGQEGGWIDLYIFPRKGKYKQDC